MKILANHNFKESDIADRNYEELYKTRRRDAFFALAFEEDDGSVVALRDHLGSVPLYYRVQDGKIAVSVFLPDLLTSKDEIDPDGLITYLGFSTSKFEPLFKGVGVVHPGQVLKIKTDGSTEALYEYEWKTNDTFKGSFEESVEEMDRLMFQAVKRGLKENIKTVGLYMSGGIDSALTGLYLKKAGVEINAYTSLPWGSTGTEAKFANINAEVCGAKEHHSVALKTSDYERLLNECTDLYKNPRFISSQIGIASIWSDTPIKEEEQVWCGQNADTLLCTMPDQFQVLFASYLPKAVRNKLHPWIGVGNYMEDYIHVTSHMRNKSVASFDNERVMKENKIAALTLAGMLVGHTGDGEAFSTPSVASGKLFGDPFFDVDVIESGMSLPLSQRIGASLKSKSVLHLEKKIYQALALKYLPAELVYRKKGLTVPINRDDVSKKFFDELPKEIKGVTLGHPEERLAARALELFVNKHSLTI